MTPRTVLLALLLTLPLAAEDLQQDVARIEGATLEPAKAISVQNVVLNVGRAAITLDRGTLIPSSATDNGAAEVVFFGEGRIVLEPPDAIERSQLELFTGKSTLDEEFTEAVIVTADDAIAAALVERRASARPDSDGLKPVAPQAVAIYEAWKNGPYRRNLNVASNLFADHLGEPAAQTFFAALFTNASLGEFVYTIDPDSTEEITLGQFLPEELTEREKRRAQRQLAREQRRGRAIGVRLDDLGTWNTWVSATLDDRGDAAAFEPRHYMLDASIAPGSLMLNATSRIDLSATTGGRRVLSFVLHPDLRVQRVSDASGRDLFHHRWHDELLVVLPTAPAANSDFTLNIAYSGVAVEKVERKTFAVRDPMHWYPQTGLRDRATYEATFRWPKKLQLLAAGRRVDGGTASDGSPWAKYELSLPSAEFGFEIGAFEVERFRAGHVEVTLGFDASGNRLENSIRKEIREAVDASLRDLEEKFGPYPLDHLTVVTVPRSYSQSLLSFITLSTDMMSNYGIWAEVLRATDRRTVIAHELAHQWWGHAVGWRDYRARWISEAMAQYAAMRFARELQFRNRMRVIPTAGWAPRLTAVTPDGRTVESVGPLVLGERLSSSRAPSGYPAIVYDKGGLVLQMLGRAIGESRFDAALRAIVQRAAGKLISTEQFIDMLAEATGLEVAPFARQWIYGTGIPTISYSHEVVRLASGAWRVQGTARQTSEARFQYRIVRDEQGRLDVQRRRVVDAETSAIPIFVPVRIEVLNPADDKVKPRKADQGSGYTFHSIVIRGKETRFEIDTDWEPKGLWLDPAREVLAHFQDEKRNSRYMLVESAEELAADGKWSEAEREYRAALAAAPDERGFLEARLHLGLARTLLETNRDREATQSLKNARSTLHNLLRPLFQTEMAVLEARIELRRSDAEAAFRRLRSLLTSKDAIPSAEGYVVLAIAAQQSGHAREFEKARDRARETGIDVSLFGSAAAKPPL